MTDLEECLNKVKDELDKNKISYKPSYYSFSEEYRGTSRVEMRTKRLPISYDGKGRLRYTDATEYKIAEKIATKCNVKLAPFCVWSAEDVPEEETEWIPIYLSICTDEKEVERTAQNMIRAQRLLTEAVVKLDKIRDKKVDELIEKLVE
jgi:hypothetical protein